MLKSTRSITAVFYICRDRRVQNAIVKKDKEFCQKFSAKIFTLNFENVLDDQIELPFRNSENKVFVLMWGQFLGQTRVKIGFGLKICKTLESWTFKIFREYSVRENGTFSFFFIWWQELALNKDKYDPFFLWLCWSNRAALKKFKLLYLRSKLST